jgi:hypothetical protein
MFSEIHENSPSLVNGAVAGSVLTGVGGLWANIHPDEVMPWVTAIAGVIWVMTNVGIMTYKRISAAIRDDQREWREYHASLESPYNVHHAKTEDPRHSQAPDPDAQAGVQGPG